MSGIYKIPQGKIIIIYSDKALSVGVLELEPKQKLEKHDRPIDEKLLQIYGTSTIEFFDNKKIVLNGNKSLTISAGQTHIHSNLSNEKSITLWKFEGDITKIIQNIKNNFKKI